jgi:translation initiation factor 3 subunit I
MKPIILKGHIKPVTNVCFNKQGDLLFVSSKDKMVSVWYTENGELLGTYPHKGAVNWVDVNYDSTLIASACSTGDVYLWDVKSGKELSEKWTVNNAPIRVVQFSTGGKQLLVVVEKAYGNPSTVAIVDIDLTQTDKKKVLSVHSSIKFDNKALHAIWGPLNEHFIVGFDDGSVKVFETKSMECVKTIHDHKNGITRVISQNEGMMFITCSNDNTARIYDSIKFECLKTFSSGEPVNSACISPNKNYLILGGGTSAVNVTTTHARVAYFETRFFHLVYEEEIATVKGHFGPIHALVFSPDGKSFVSGGEDGFVKIYPLESEFEKWKE